jgi:hypothetical protein
MKERKNQFVTPELASEGVGASPSSRQSGEDKKALDWANSNPNERAAQINVRLSVLPDWKNQMPR